MIYDCVVHAYVDQARARLSDGCLLCVVCVSGLFALILSLRCVLLVLISDCLVGALAIDCFQYTLVASTVSPWLFYLFL